MEERNRRKKWNRKMREENGNGKINVIYQNLPCTYRSRSAETLILELIQKFKPLCLFLGEIGHDVLSSCSIPDYKLIAGKKVNSNNTRMNCFIQDTCQHEVLGVTCDVPTVAIRTMDWNLIGIYREWQVPGNNGSMNLKMQEDRFGTLTGMLKTLRGSTCCLGDFNFDLIHVDSEYQRRFDRMRELVADDLLMQGWSQVVDEPTRSQKGKNQALLDHIYTNNIDHVDGHFNRNIVGTDHNMIGAAISTKEPVFQRRVIVTRRIDDIDKEDFTREFLGSNPSEIFHSGDVDEALVMLNTKIMSVINRLAPERRIVTRPDYMPWLTPGLKAAIRVRNEMRKIASKSRDDQDWADYRQFRQEVMEMLNVSKEEHQRKFFNTEDTKQQWKRIEENAKIKAGKSSGNVILQTDEGVVKDPKKVATIFNDYFKSKVEKLQARTKPDPKASAEYTKRFLKGKDPGFLSFRCTDYVEVVEIIRSLKNTDSCGIDGINTKVLKRFDTALAPPLVHVINLILTKSTWPKAWKVGIISPVPKKNDLSRTENWRPVVLNAVMSKIAERIINKQLTDHLEARGLLSQTQHAYRSQKSCSSAWLDIDSYISKGLAEEKVCGMVLTDQSAAFNVLMKEVLAEKLPLYGLSPDAVKMIVSFLSDRSTVCKIAGERSGTVRLSSGVPEGSILGPSLYTLAQMDVPTVPELVKEIAVEEEAWRIERPEEVDTSSVEYADDVTGLLQAANEEDFQVVADVFMEQFEEYFSRCGLALNRSKCCVIVFRPGKKTKTITLADQEEVSHVKLLGLTIDSSYTFVRHVSKVKSNIEYRISCLKKVLKFFNVKRRKEIAQALVISVVKFGIEFWGRETQHHGNIQVSINKLMRSILDEPYDAQVKPMMTRLQWSNFSNMHRETSVTTLRKLILQRQSTKAYSLINLQPSVYLTRFRELKLTWTENEGNKFKTNSYMVSATKLYNDLKMFAHKDVTNAEFKRKLMGRVHEKFPNENIKNQKKKLNLGP